MGRGVAVVTGASSGIGAATARHLAADGWDVVAGARRLDRLRQVTDPIGARALALDVTDERSVAEFAASVPECRLLVNNAGGASGLEPVATADLSRWQAMFDANVLGAVRMTQALLPALRQSGDGHVVIVGSIAGLEAYPGGAGYNAAKFGVHAVAKVLRLELLGEPLRITEIDPGMVETEFSIVRFDGDEQRAAQVYAGMTPLTGEDIAEAIAWVANRPSHVNVNQLVILPRDQADTTRVHRTELEL
jgi:NADP-dependent 3-hydroxy acid dehydrogenase YdfG